MACRVAFEVDEGRAVGDDVLHVLHVGDIEARIEDLARDPFSDCEPDLAVRVGRGADGKLVARRPRSLAAGTIACGYRRCARRLGLDQRRRCQHKRHTESDA